MINNKKIKLEVRTILNFFVIIEMIFIITYFNTIYEKKEIYNNNIQLQQQIILLENEKNNLESQITNLKNEILESKKINNNIVIENNNLNEDYNKIKEENLNLKTKINNLLEQQKNSNELLHHYWDSFGYAQNGNKIGYFKSYLPWTAIINQETDAWKINQRGVTSWEGFRVIYEDNRMYYLCAIGRAWGMEDGDKAMVLLENGYSFYIIKGDTKGKGTLTDVVPADLYHYATGCVLEFIIDTNVMKDLHLGDISKIIPRFSGRVMSITPL